MVANAIICLIHQANYLLDQQIAALEKSFIEDGGYSEQLAAARLRQREQQKNDQSDRIDQSDLTVSLDCPICGKRMVVRVARKGTQAGLRFWVCSDYPKCKGTRPMKKSDGSV